jgi:hypothetical protein
VPLRGEVLPVDEEAQIWVRPAHDISIPAQGREASAPAFKDFTTSDEVYDILVTVFLDVAAHYDPHYTKKTEEVCKYIETQPANTVVPLEQISAAMAFDPIGCVRVLVRHGYLQSVSGARKKVQGYQRGPNWPAPKGFFEGGPVGFTYFLTKVVPLLPPDIYPVADVSDRE